MKNLRIIEIEWNGSLYDPASDPFVTELENILNTVDVGTLVLLRAAHPCHDYHRAWLEGLTTKYYWEDLVAHFQRVHLLLIGICLSKAKWFFVSGEDCLGSWWDLALACHGRIWANPYAKIGFPEVYIDLIPPLASGGLRKFTVYQTLEDAKRHAILNAKDAYAAGLISLVLQGQDWASKDGLETLSIWIGKSSTVSNLRSTTRKELLDETPDILGVIENRAVLQTRRRQIASSHLDSGFVALKERNMQARALAMASTRAGGAARVLIDDYRAWLSRRITRYELGSHDRWWTQGDGIVVVDLSSGVPPHMMIQTLLSRNIHLVLSATSEDALKEGVETVLSRSQRGGISRKEVMDSWRGKVDWMIGDVKSLSAVWMACKSNDVIDFGWGSQRLLSRYRLSGNFGQTNLGWSEAVYQYDPKDSGNLAESLNGAFEVADILSNGVLHCQNWPHQVSMAVALRFLLLGEMMGLAQTGLWPDLVEQCKLLAASGWGFASDVPRWDGLIRSFASHPDLAKAMSLLGGKIDWLAKNTSMAELRVRVPKASHVARLEVSAARLSRHFEAFAVKTVESLSKIGAVESVSVADLFVTLAWGYPGASPVPSELGVDLGSDRISDYLEEQALD